MRNFLRSIFKSEDWATRKWVEHRWASRNVMLEYAMSFVQACRLEGDYLEFGVWKGDTFLRAFRWAKKNGLDAMRFYAFDSFQGLPQVNGIDQETGQFTKGLWACDVEKFRQHIAERGTDLNRVNIIEGWFAETLSPKIKGNLPIRKAAVVYVDCDLYESTVKVLDFITDYIQDGTILIFDDWFCYRGSPQLGERRAFREWLEKKQIIFGNGISKIWLAREFVHYP